ncbi:MAG: hypothetical protein ABF296_04100 [Oceanococcaceae bacterium]
MASGLILANGLALSSPAHAAPSASTRHAEPPAPEMPAHWRQPLPPTPTPSNTPAPTAAPTPTPPVSTPEPTTAAAPEPSRIAQRTTSSEYVEPRRDDTPELPSRRRIPPPPIEPVIVIVPEANLPAWERPPAPVVAGLAADPIDLSEDKALPALEPILPRLLIARRVTVASPVVVPSLTPSPSPSLLPVAAPAIPPVIGSPDVTLVEPSAPPPPSARASLPPTVQPSVDPTRAPVPVMTDAPSPTPSAVPRTTPTVALQPRQNERMVAPLQPVLPAHWRVGTASATPQPAMPQKAVATPSPSPVPRASAVLSPSPTVTVIATPTAAPRRPSLTPATVAPSTPPSSPTPLPSALATTLPVPTMPAPAPTLLTTPAPRPSVTPRATAAPVSDDVLRVYYRNEATALARRERRSLDAFVRDMERVAPGSLIAVHLGRPEGVSLMRIALRQDDVRAILTAAGVDGSRIRFRLGPLNAPALGMPLAPHFAEFQRLDPN